MGEIRVFEVFGSCENSAELVGLNWPNKIDKLVIVCMPKHCRDISKSDVTL